MNELTVLMTTYNEKKDIIKQAIESILNQTYRDFDFMIIVDNPQNLEIIKILNTYASLDKRITIVINNENMGLPLALNRGIQMIQTKYLARMDADDIALPDRFEKQMNFIQKNPEIVLVGGNIIYMDYAGETLYNRGSIATENKHLKDVMKYMNMFNHPTFLGKTEVFKKYMYRNLRYSQDYDFVCRLLEKGENVANIPDYLLKYRIVEISNSEKKVRQKVTMHCVQSQYKKGHLSDVKIEALVDECIKKINKEKMIRDMEEYDADMDLIRSHKYVQGIGKILCLFVKSKTVNKDIYNLFVFYFLKKIYKF